MMTSLATVAPTTGQILAFPPFRGQPYMPYRLKGLLVTHGISQRELAGAVTQTNGEPLSGASMTQILNFGYYPRSTPVAAIRGQIEQFLRARALPEEEIAQIWEISPGEDEMRHRHPVGHHTNARRRASRREEIEFEPPEVQMLSPAARRQFKLLADPFNRDLQGPQDIFVGEDQRYALDLVLAAIHGRRLFALVGESGSGKSTLMDLLRQRVLDERLPIRFLQPRLPDKGRLTSRMVLEAILMDIRGPRARPNSSSEMLSRTVESLLIASTQSAEDAPIQHNVLFFEEAHDLSLSALKHLKRFHEIKADRWTRTLSILLIGQPELLTRLEAEGAVEAREVSRRLEHHTLLPLDGALPEYIAHRLGRANLRAADLFEPDSYAAIGERLSGTVKRANGTQRISLTYPLLVNNLATRALNLAAELGAARVDAGIVRGVTK